MTTPRVLIVSDVQAELSPWPAVFPRSHWNLSIENNLTNLSQRLFEETPDMLVIDIELAAPDILDLIRGVRREVVIPILLLIPTTSDDFIIEAYNLGVDDCILKPVSHSLLRAKFKAWLRHTGSMHIGSLDPLSIGKIELIPADRTIIIESSDPIKLTNLEFRLLYTLLGRRNRVLTTEELCQRIWLDWDAGDAAALKNIVYRLRKKIEANPSAPQYIRTVAGVGYEFVVE